MRESCEREGLRRRGSELRILNRLLNCVGADLDWVGEGDTPRYPRSARALVAWGMGREPEDADRGRDRLAHLGLVTHNDGNTEALRLRYGDQVMELSDSPDSMQAAFDTIDQLAADASRLQKEDAVSALQCLDNLSDVVQILVNQADQSLRRPAGRR